MLSDRFRPRRGSRVAVAVLGTSLLCLAGASGAYGQSPSLTGYGGQGGETEGIVTPGGQAPQGEVLPESTTPTQGVAPAEEGGNEVLGAQAEGNAPAARNAPVAAAAPAAAQAKNRLVGNLPFTGLDLALLAGAGLGLAGLGLGLRRMTGSQPQAG